MKVAALRFTRRWNLGNYEHTELSVETVPDEDQTAEELLQATRDFVEGKKPSTNGAPVSNGNGKPKPDDDLTETLKKSVEETKRNGSPANGNGKKKGRGRPPKAVSDARKAVRYALESATMGDLLDRYNDARELAGSLDLNEWEQANKDLADVYRELNGPHEDAEVVSQLIAAFKAEKTALAEKREAEDD